MEDIEQEVIGHYRQHPSVDYWGTTLDERHVSDYFRTSRTRFELILARIRELARVGARIADVGPAYGAILLALKRERYAVTAYEMPECIEAYTDVLRRERIPVVPWNLHTNDMQGAFDLVIASEILEHLQISLAAAVRKLSRLLAPGGTLLVTTPNAYCLPNMVRILRGINIQEPFVDRAAFVSGVVVDARTHPREPVMGELLAAMGAAGLSVTHKSCFNTMPRPRIRELAYSFVPNSWKDHLHVEAQMRP